MNLKIKLFDSRFDDQQLPLPSYSTEGSAGLDLRCMIPSSAYLQHISLDINETAVISTGIAVEIGPQSPSIFGLIAVRSSWGRQGLCLQNTIGIVDSDYQGEILLHVVNRGQNPLKIKSLERIAQLVLVHYSQVTSWSIIPEFTSRTARGEGGFGSTGNS